MERRDFIILFTGVVVAWPLCLQAQQPKKVPRIGYLSPRDPASESSRSEAIRLALLERANKVIK